MPTPADILKDTMELMAQKRAQFEEPKKAMEGESPESLPGAENTRPVDKSDEQPDPEITQKPDMPEGATSAPAASATGGGMENTDEMSTPELPDAKEKKPLIRTADKMANDIIAQIRSFQSSVEKAAQDATEKTKSEEGDKAEEGKTDKPSEEIAEVKKEEGEITVDANTESSPDASTGKAAESFTLTQEVLAKMAAITLAYEEGRDFMEAILTEHAGAEKAAEVFDFISQRSEEFDKQAAEEQGYQDGLRALIEEAYNAGLKAAGVDPHAEELYKVGQMLADESLEGLMPPPEGAAMPPMPGPVADEAAAVPAALEAVPEEAMEGAEEDVTLEDVAEALDILVEEGAIDPESAAEIQKQVAEEVEGASMEEAPAEEAPAEEAPAESESMMDEEPTEEPAA